MSESKAHAPGWTDSMLAAARRRFAEVLPVVRAIARQHGYAVAVHGSQLRDLDLVAVPWVEQVSPPHVLVEAIRVAVGGFILTAAAAQPGDFTSRNPQSKPHGRLAWAIHLGAGPYLDLSVMPTRETA